LKILIIPALAVIAAAAGIGGAILFERIEPTFKPDGFEAIAPPVEITAPPSLDPGRMEDSLLPIWMTLPLVDDTDYALLDARIDYLANGITYRLNYSGPGEPDLTQTLIEIRTAFRDPRGAACRAISFDRYPDEATSIKLVVGDLKVTTAIPAGACAR
jgi:hypothetical protein|tara:strand:+ start:88 stop:561 length:474 start_codon:yes stop_codon:yes gene_type:complete